MRILMITMIQGLHIALAGTLFRLNAGPCRSSVQTFATHDIGDALLERRHHAHMEHITLAREDHLSASPDNDGVTSGSCCLDNIAQRVLVGEFSRRWGRRRCSQEWRS